MIDSDRVKLIAGASGYSFKEWKGVFYPEKIKPEAMLAWYAARLPTVEINNTFYRMPKTDGARELGRHDARRTSASRSRRRGASRTCAAQGRVAAELRRLPLSQPRGARREARPGAVPAAAVPEEGPAAPRRRFSRCCPRITAPRSNSATRAGSTTTSTPRSRARARRWCCRSARTTRRRRWWRRRLRATCGCGSRTIRTTISGAGPSGSPATGWREIYVYFMHEPTAPAYARR